MGKSGGGDSSGRHLKSRLSGTWLPWYLDIQDATPYGTQEITMSPAKRYARTQAKARERRRQTAQKRLERDRRQAQQAAEALRQALDELGLPDGLGRKIEGRLRS